MTKRILVTTFAREEDLVRTVHEFRARRLKILDAYSPYPVHELDEALGWPPSRLGWACAALGAGGATFMYWFQHWTSAVDWPINVGGKPWNSLPAFAPVIFESMVLAAGLGTVLLFLLVSRLRPGRKAKLIHPDITDDQFALVVEETDAAFDLDALRPLLHRNRALLIEERTLDVQQRSPGAEGDEDASRRGRLALNYTLAALVIVVIAAAWSFSPDLSRRNWEIMPTMVWSPAYDAYEARAELLSRPAPVPGAIARGRIPLAYAATPEDAERAAQELRNPFSAHEAGAVARGAAIYQNFCAACHGGGGQGDGPVAQRGYPPPPSFAIGASRSLPDGHLFHIVTYGQRNMPPHGPLLEPEDRWKVILHIRQLQGAADTTERSP